MREIYVRDHEFSTFANFSKILTFLPTDTHIGACAGGQVSSRPHKKNKKMNISVPKIDAIRVTTKQTNFICT